MIRAQVETALLDQCAIHSLLSTHFVTVIDQQLVCYLRGVLLFAHCHTITL